MYLKQNGLAIYGLVTCKLEFNHYEVHRSSESDAESQASALVASTIRSSRSIRRRKIDRRWNWGRKLLTICPALNASMFLRRLTNCGEVPRVLDSSVRTIPYQNTNNKN